MTQVGSATGVRPAQFAWGLVDQALSSATTFVFTVVGARNLGPTGLGTVALGYGLLLVALGLQRSLVVEPLLARLSTSARTAREAFRGAASASLVGSTVLALAALAIGSTFSGAAAQGVLIFAPWVVPALSQGLLRAWLYREGRGRAATLSSLVWFITMVIAFSLGLKTTDWQIVAAWGLGACAALVYASLRVPGMGLAGVSPALSWLRQEAVGLGSWRVVASIVYSAASYLRIAGLSAILGPAAVGGYRAIDSMYAPASFVGPALGNPGLPTMRDAIERRPHDAWPIALTMSAASFGFVSVYVLAVWLGEDVVFRLYGSAFREYAFLVPPIAVAQVIASVGLGFSVLLLAARRMRETTVIVVAHSMLTLIIALSLAAISGLEAAAWGLALAEVPLMCMTVILARKASTRDPSTVLGA